MQTFLPLADFEATARVLDDRRLGKQRVEALQVLRALTVAGYGWRHHPAAKMWTGHEEALAAYGLAVCREWRRRGYADTCEAKIRAEARSAGVVDVRAQTDLAGAGALPAWLGDHAFHLAHRSALVRKAPEWYRAFFPDVADDLEYVWPPAPGSGGPAAPA